MIEIFTHRVRTPTLDERLRRPAVKRWDRLRTIPRHGLRLASRPVADTADDLQHFGHARLSFRRNPPVRLGHRSKPEARCLGELAFRHPEDIRHTIHVNETRWSHEACHEACPGDRCMQRCGFCERQATLRCAPASRAMTHVYFSLGHVPPFVPKKDEIWDENPEIARTMLRLLISAES